MPLTYNVPVHVNDQYADDIPTHARIVLDKRLLKRILKLKRIVKSVKDGYAIEVWDYTPDLLKGAEDDDDDTEAWEGGSEAMRLKVEDDCFLWEWYIKHTDVLCSTESIRFGDVEDELKENRLVLHAPKRELPHLAVSDKLKYKSSKALVEKRLKGE